MSLVNVVCCQVEVCTSGLSLVQREPTELGVSKECDREAPSGEAMIRNGVEAPQGRKKTSNSFAEKRKRYKKG
jgi:hypothetical protein